MTNEVNNKKIVHAVIAAIYQKNYKNNTLELLVAERGQDQSYAGYWGLPGGKIENGEEPYCALIRELHEELGINVAQAEFINTVLHDYPEFSVQLEVYKVHEYLGEVYNKEGQVLQWIEVDKITELKPLLEASYKIIKLLE